MVSTHDVVALRTNNRIGRSRSVGRIGDFKDGVVEVSKYRTVDAYSGVIRPRTIINTDNIRRGIGCATFILTEKTLIETILRIGTNDRRSIYVAQCFADSCRIATDIEGVC